MAEWVLNIGVRSDYDRTDLSDHASEVAAEVDLRGTGVAMFTAVDLSRRQRCISGGVVVDATVGISHPTWAAGTPATETPAVGGTINLVVQLPVGLDPGAAVNAVITATEAKAQALASPRGAGNRDRHRRGHDRVAGRGRCGAVRRAAVTLGYQHRPSRLPGSTGRSRTTRLIPAGTAIRPAARAGFLEPRLARHGMPTLGGVRGRAGPRAGRGGTRHTQFPVTHATDSRLRT